MKQVMIYLGVGLEYMEKVRALQISFQESLGHGVAEGVYSSVKVLGIAVIAYIMIEGIVKALASGGGEPIDPIKHIGKPIMYFLILLFWGQILGAIDAVGMYLSASIENSVLNDSISGEDVFVAYTKKMKSQLADKTLLDKVSSIVTLGASDLSGWLQLMILEGAIAIGLFFEKISLVLFMGYTEIIKMLLKITGIIALVLSMTGKFKSFWMWVSNFLAVHLWMVLAFLIFFLIDKLFISFVNYEMAANDGAIYENYFLGLRHILYFIAFGIMKLVLMFKIPNIVSMFIGSSSGSGGMFAAAFVPMKIATEGGKAMANKGKNLKDNFKK